MEQAVDIPDAYRATTVEVRLPFVNDQIERLVNNLTLNRPAFHVRPPRPGPAAQERSTRLEKGIAALFERLCFEADEDLFYTSVDGAVETGQAVLKVLLRTDRWDMPARASDDTDQEYLAKTKEAKRSKRLPIVARLIDRRSYYERKDEDGLARVVEVSKRRVDDLYTEFGKSAVQAAFDQAGLPIDEFSEDSYGRQVNLIEYWDREYAAYVIAPDLTGSGRAGLIRRFKHGYHRPPYFTGYGSQTSSTDPNKKGLSAAFPVKYLVPYLNSLYTMMGNVAYITAYPTIKELRQKGTVEASMSEDSDEDPRESLTFEPGTLMRGPAGTDWKPMEFGPLSSAMTGLISEMKGFAQSAMLPGIMQGLPPGSRTSGYAIQELAATAKAKYQTTVTNIQKMWSEALGFALYLIDRKIAQSLELPADVLTESGVSTHDWITLDPKDINGYYQVEVKIQPRNPEDRIREGTFMANMHVAGVATKRQVIEEGLGKENPDEILDELLVEEWLSSPEIAAYIRQQAIQEAGLAGFQEEIQAANALFQTQMQALNMAQQGGAMGGGGPGGPGQGPAGANGMMGGQANPGQPSMMAPTAPAQSIPGTPMQPQPGQGTGQQQGLPRQYRAKAGAPAGGAQTQPARPPIEGFRSR